MSKQLQFLSLQQIKAFHRDGFILVKNVVPHSVLVQLRDRVERLFEDRFETGVYPDEWHWRKGISKEHATKEIVNAWKSDRLIASLVLSERLGNFCSQLMGWESARIAQDDVIIKPSRNGSAVGYHQDSRYISDQFIPRQGNSVTCWIPLDNTDIPNIGTIEYAKGSHLISSPITQNHEIASGFHTAESESENSYRSPFLQYLGKDYPEENFIKVPATAGSVVFHHQDVWHGSGPNISENPRRAVVSHLINGDVRFSNSSHPWKATYIYGRYRLLESDELAEQFFPVIYPNEKRSKFLQDYCKDALI